MWFANPNLTTNVLALIKRVKWNQWVLNSAQYGFYAFIKRLNKFQDHQKYKSNTKRRRLHIQIIPKCLWILIVNIYEEILIVLSWYASVTSHIFPRVAEIRGNRQGQGTMKIMSRAVRTMRLPTRFLQICQPYFNWGGGRLCPTN